MKRYCGALAAVVLSCGIMCLAGCGSEQSGETQKGKFTVKEDSEGVEVRSEDGSVTIQGNEKAGRVKIKTEEGEDLEVTYNKDELAEGFPTDIPLYSPAKITMSQILKDKNAIATLSSQDDTTLVAAFYKDSLPKTGWSLEGEMNMGAMVILQGKKAEKLLNISIVKGENETNITLAVTEDTESSEKSPGLPDTEQ